MSPAPASDAVAAALGPVSAHLVAPAEGPFDAGDFGSRSSTLQAIELMVHDSLLGVRVLEVGEAEHPRRGRG